MQKQKRKKVILTENGNLDCFNKHDELSLYKRLIKNNIPALQHNPSSVKVDHF